MPVVARGTRRWAAGHNPVPTQDHATGAATRLVRRDGASERDVCRGGGACGAGVDASRGGDGCGGRGGCEARAHAPTPSKKAGVESGGMQEDKASEYFECNICLDLAQEPVVTQCGHLYCWPCIYKWLQVFRDAQQCPVCKAVLPEDMIIPLYGRGTCGGDPRPKHTGKDVPLRPPGIRLPVKSVHLGEGWGGQDRVGGLVTSVLGFGFQFNAGVRTSLRGGDPLSPEQQQHSFLSRLLLLLGSFVILCLLIF